MDTHGQVYAVRAMPWRDVYLHIVNSFVRTTLFAQIRWSERDTHTRACGVLVWTTDKSQYELSVHNPEKKEEKYVCA